MENQETTFIAVIKSIMTAKRKMSVLTFGALLATSITYLLAEKLGILNDQTMIFTVIIFVISVFFFFLISALIFEYAKLKLTRVSNQGLSDNTQKQTQKKSSPKKVKSKKSGS